MIMCGLSINNGREKGTSGGDMIRTGCDTQQCLPGHTKTLAVGFCKKKKMFLSELIIKVLEDLAFMFLSNS